MLLVGTSGRHPDDEKNDAFEAACQWLESESALLTLDELIQAMTDSGWKEQYSKKRMKKKLQERYGNHIVFGEVAGKHDVICFRDICSFILSEQWYKERKSNVEEEKFRIIKTAAKLIASEIREITYDMNSYPEVNQLTEECSVVPPLLQNLMKSLVRNQLKCSAISQCIVQGARPRSIITPLLFGLSVELDHLFASKTLLIQLARLGFSLSYHLMTKSCVTSNQLCHLRHQEQLPACHTLLHSHSTWRIMLTIMLVP